MREHLEDDVETDEKKTKKLRNLSESEREDIYYLLV